MKKLVLLVILLLSVPLLKAEEKHCFWDRKNIRLHLINLTAQSVDAYSTQRLLNIRRRKRIEPAGPTTGSLWVERTGRRQLRAGLRRHLVGQLPPPSVGSSQVGAHHANPCCHPNGACGWIEFPLLATPLLRPAFPPACQ